ncbi:MAG: hypothetical protein ACREN5_07365, partial [Gemmatimonadales bacterium]
GAPEPGRIPPGATCALFMAGPARIRLQQIARGRGDAPGLAPGVARVRVEQAFVEPPWTEPPAAVASRLLAPEVLAPNIPTIRWRLAGGHEPAGSAKGTATVGGARG